MTIVKPRTDYILTPLYFDHCLRSFVDIWCKTKTIYDKNMIDVSMGKTPRKHKILPNLAMNNAASVL